MGKVILKISKRLFAKTMKNSVLADINQCIKINKQKNPVDIVQFSIWCNYLYHASLALVSVNDNW